MLRCLEMGVRPSELALFTYGEIIDMMTESSNDQEKYQQIATQEDFDRF